MKKYLPIVLLVMSFLLSVGSLTVSLTQKGNVNLGALPVFKKFQVLSPVSFGAVMSDGVSTTTLVASTTPTVKGLTATSSLQMTNQAGGCAQFGSTGFLTSTGSNCAAAGGGKTIDFYAATSSRTSTGSAIAAATTTSIVSGGSLMIWASCSVSNPGGEFKLEVGNPGGGTTSIAYVDVGSGGTYQIKSSPLFGVYTATTSGKAFIAIDADADGSLITNCLDPMITYLRFTN
jgi:hypothetical protein